MFCLLLAPVILFQCYLAIFVHCSLQLMVWKFVVCITASKHDLAMQKVVLVKYVLILYVMPPGSGEDPKLQNTLKNASY